MHPGDLQAPVFNENRSWVHWERQNKVTKGALWNMAAFSHCGSGIPVQSLPGPEMNFRHASYLSWLTRNLLRGVEPTVALGYE
jgi:hypothetical protein